MDLILPLRALQFIFAIIVLGLTAYSLSPVALSENSQADCCA